MVYPVIAMSEIDGFRSRRHKTGGRQRGTPNRVTSDIRQALRNLADGNAPRVQDWLTRVAETDPAEATRLWLSLLRFVTPTLQAAGIADLRNPGTAQPLYAMTDQELLALIAEQRSRSFPPAIETHSSDTRSSPLERPAVTLARPCDYLQRSARRETKGFHVELPDPDDPASQIE